MKTYGHRCQSTHRTLNKYARCVWPNAIWVHGEGRYALLAHCAVLTVSLHARLEDAEKWKTIIDTSLCGGRCYRDHEIVQLNKNP
jgi:hypothetical protein